MYRRHNFSFQYFSTSLKSLYVFLLPIVHALISKTILPMSLKCFTLFKLTIECFAVKKALRELLIRMHRYTKEFRYISVNGQKFIKRAFQYVCTTLNITKLQPFMYAKNIFTIKITVLLVLIFRIQDHKKEHSRITYCG